MNPTESLKEKAGGPADWLGFDRYDREFAADEDELRAMEFRGALRGTVVDWGRLRRALDLSVEKVGEGQYRVWNPRPKGKRQWWHLAFNPEPGPVVEADTEQYVDVVNKVDRCYCRDMIVTGEAQGIPCIHLYAALIAHGDRQVLELVEELKKLDAIAAAVEKVEA